MVKTIRGWIVAFSQIDTGWESVYDRLHAHIEKQRLAETEIYILDPMTAQLTHETWLTSIALSTTSFPIIWCAGHLPAQNNDGHMFYQKLFLCINDGPVIVTGISLLYQRRAFYCDRHEQRRHPFPFHGMRSRLLLSNYAWLLRRKRRYLRKERNRTQENGQNQKSSVIWE